MGLCKLLCWCLLGGALAGSVAAAPTPARRPPKETPLVWVGDLVLRRPSQFHRVEDHRDRMLFECDAKDGWCQLGFGVAELGQKAEFHKQDARKLVQGLFPYLSKPKGAKWKESRWLGQPAYRIEFSAAGANIRLFSVQTFAVRGGLLFYAGINCIEAQRARWQPAYDEWIKTAKYR